MPNPLPPKVEMEIEDKANNWYRTLASMAIFVAILLFLGLETVLVLLLIGVMFLHEMGHFVAMKAFGYQNVNMFFVPLLGAYVSGEKSKVSQRQEMITLLAGPVPGIMLGMILILPMFAGTAPWLFGMSLPLRLGLILLMLNVLNMFPFFPLDGGRIVEILFTRGNLWIRMALVAAFFLLNIYYLITTGSTIAIVVGVLLLSILQANWQIIRNQIALRKMGVDTSISIEDMDRATYWKLHFYIMQTHPRLSKKQEVVRRLSSFIPYSHEEKIGIREKAAFFAIWLVFLVLPLVEVYLFYGEYLQYLLYL